MRQRNSLKKSIKADLSITLVVSLAIGLLILVIYFGWFSKGASLIHKSTSCGSIGGVLSSSCNDYVSVENTAFNDNKKKLKCCVKKLDTSQINYDKWVATLEPNSSTNENNYDDVVVYGFENYDVPSDEIPDYGSGETVSSSNVVNGRIGFKINNQPIKEGETARVRTIVSVEATNSYKNSDECILNIRHSTNGKSDKPSIKSYIQKPCKKKDTLRFSIDNLPPLPKNERYKVKFVVNNNNKMVFSGAVFLETINDDSTETTEGSSSNSNNKYTILDLQDFNPKYVNRDGISQAYFTYFLPGDYNNEGLSFYYEYVDQEDSCPNINENYQPVELFKKVSIPNNKQLCVAVKILDSGEYAYYHYKTNIRMFEILDNEGYQKLFNGCPVQSCEYYSTDDAKCINYNLREVSCQRTLNCFWSRADENHNRKFCASCEEKGITSCEDLDTEAACLKNDCLPFSCIWHKGNLFVRGTCEDS